MGVQKKLGLSQQGVEILKKQFKQSGVKWGLDAEREDDLPSFEESSWSFGKDRLVASYGMALEGEKRFEGIFPYDQPLSRDESEELGKFTLFLQEIAIVKKEWKEEATLTNWSKRFKSIALKCLDLPEASLNKRILFSKLNLLEQKETLCEFNQTLSFSIVKSHVQEFFCQTKPHSFGRGVEVLFASASYVRGLPFKVLCFLGLHGDESPYGSFPRKETEDSFNLMRYQKRSGDPLRKQNDRSLFFESLVSAHDIFYMSYVGIETRTQKKIDPSILILDFTDTMMEFFNEKEHSLVLKRLFFEHPLHGFDESYFMSNSPFKNYSKEDFLIAKNRIRKHNDSEKNKFSPTVSKLSHFEKNSQKILLLEEMISFFSNPQKFFYRKKLGISLREIEENQNDVETFSLTSWLQFFIGEELMNRKDRILSFEEEHAFFSAQGKIPFGEVGKMAFKNLYEEILQFKNVLYQFEKGKTETKSINFNFDSYRLQGKVFVRKDGSLIDYYFKKSEEKAFLSSWISMLFASASEPNASIKSFLVLRDKEKQGVRVHLFSPVKESKDILLTLINFFFEGQKSPLAFCPELSYWYAKENFNNGCLEDSIVKKKVKQKWKNKQFSYKKKDPYRKLAYPEEDDFFKEPFGEIAKAIYHPLLIKKDGAV